MRTCRALTFEEAAVLRGVGCRFLTAEPSGRRIALLFDDSNGHASKVLAEHREKGVTVNSQEFQTGLAWAKSVIFATKDSR